MCYNVNYLTKKRLEYARRLKGIIDEKVVEKEYEELYNRSGPVFYINGFNHPDLPVITNTLPDHLQALSWGLIPFWVKDPAQAVNLSKQTLNARGESMFDKPSFRNAARNKRCLVLVDGFFEYHWHKGKSYPFYIKMANNEPMLLAGIWETWRYQKEDMVRHTCCIVTTEANSIMASIHNKPRGSEGPRMPVIIPKGFESEWLMDLEDQLDRQRIEELVQPYDDSELMAYTVSRLQGKTGVGNVREALDKHVYPELSNLDWL